MPKEGFVTIIVAGKMKSGKDEIARLLKESRPSVERLALADKLKLAVAHAHEVSVFHLEANKAQYRASLILVGKAARYLDPEIWLKQLDHQKLMHSDSIVTDVRFQNEFFYFKQKSTQRHRVVTVKVKAAEAVRIVRGAQPEFFNDPTETELDGLPDSLYDEIIENNGTIEELALKVQTQIVEKYL